MKKRVKFSLIALVVVIIIWITMFTTDYIRVSSLKTPIFTIKSNIKDDLGSGTYYGLGYSIEIQKMRFPEKDIAIEFSEMYILGKLINASIQ